MPSAASPWWVQHPVSLRGICVTSLPLADISLAAGGAAHPDWLVLTALGAASERGTAPSLVSGQRTHVGYRVLDRRP